MTEHVPAGEPEPRGAQPPFPAADPATAMAAARKVAERARQSETEIESTGSLPPDLIDLMRTEGLFSLALPRELGGLGAAPSTVVDVVAELSAADASTGWTALVGQTSAFLAWAPRHFAERIVEATPQPIIAGSMAPTGRAIPVAGEDGDAYRLSGQWAYNSGCHHADWYVVTFLVHTEEGGPLIDDGRPRMLMTVLPRGDARITHTWEVMGLYGTGSDDLVIDGAHVDKAWMFDPYAGPSAYPGPLQGWPFYSFLMAMMAGFPLGTGTRALAEFTAQARRESRLGTRHRLVEDPLIQAGLLRHTTRMRAARLLVDNAVSAVAGSADSPGLAVRAELVASVQHAMRTATESADWAFRSAGGSAVYSTHPLQRVWRDLTAGGQHIAFSSDAERRAARGLLGLHEDFAHLV